jgi:aspartyl-tRNA(Asn)/glutamyl-tRNA(Gln) amidotransferase subunit B
MKAIGFLVGQVMKLSKGKANPQMATDLIKKQLGQ